MSPSAAVYLALVSVICDVVVVGVLAAWMASRKRISSETVGRAEQHAAQLTQQAEREAESLRKEAQLEAREKAHGMVADAEAKVRTRQLEIAGLEQGLADKTRALADRVAASDTLERDLRDRAAAAADLRARLDAAAAKSEQVLAERQRELQRVAGL